MNYLTELAQCEATYAALKRELADSQAENKVLRSALEIIRIRPWHSQVGARATLALKQSTGDNALKAALTAERERIAAHFDGKDEMFGDSIADAIRALGD